MGIINRAITIAIHVLTIFGLSFLGWLYCDYLGAFTVAGASVVGANVMRFMPWWDESRI